jgi:hypothetical protein
MKYLVELNALNSKPVQSFAFADSGEARAAFVESRQHPFSVESVLVAVTETGTRMTMAREFH